jgi:hypothetical protein
MNQPDVTTGLIFTCMEGSKVTTVKKSVSATKNTGRNILLCMYHFPKCDIRLQHYFTNLEKFLTCSKTFVTFCVCPYSKKNIVQANPHPFVAKVYKSNKKNQCIKHLCQLIQYLKNKYATLEQYPCDIPKKFIVAPFLFLQQK